MKSLCIIHVVLTQHLQNVTIFDTFGNRLAPKSLSQINDGFNDCLILRTTYEPSNKFDINLEIFHLELLNVSKGSVSRAKVIERNTATEGYDTISERMTLFDIAHERSFGDFEYEIRGVGTCAFDFSFDERQHVKGYDGLS